MQHLVRLMQVALLLLLPLATLAQEPSFEIDALNPSLGDPPANVFRDTPQATLETLLAAGSAEDWPAAAHLLDIPPDYEPEDAAELARQLFVIIDRKVLIDWSRLVDRPDGLDGLASSDNAMAGQVRRSILLALIDLPRYPVALRINRVKPASGDAVWVFSRQTVQNIPALYGIYGPSEFESMLPAPLKTEAFWSLRWWEVIALPLMLAVAALIGWLVYRAMSFGATTLNRLGIPAIIQAARPASVLAAITTFIGFMVTQVFVFSGAISVIISPLLTIGYVVAILWLLVNVVEIVIQRLVSYEGDDLTAMGDGQDQKRKLATNIAAARRVIIVLVVVIGAGITLSQANILRTLGFSLLASAGAITLLLAYAARNVLSNVMSSLQIAFSKSARIGDKVMYDGYLCSVERINFTYVQLRVWTGERLVVPVNEFVMTTFENWTMQEPMMIRTVTLKLAHDADIDALRDAYEDVLDSIEDGLEPDGERGVHVTGQDVFGQDVLFKVPCADPNTAWGIATDVREKLIKAAVDIGEDTDAAMFPDVSAAEAG